jgi:hypothetical protein
MVPQLIEFGPVIDWLRALPYGTVVGGASIDSDIHDGRLFVCTAVVSLTGERGLTACEAFEWRSQSLLLPQQRLSSPEQPAPTLLRRPGIRAASRSSRATQSRRHPLRVSFGQRLMKRYGSTPAALVGSVIANDEESWNLQVGTVYMTGEAPTVATLR